MKYNNDFWHGVYIGIWAGVAIMLFVRIIVMLK